MKLRLEIQQKYVHVYYDRVKTVRISIINKNK